MSQADLPHAILKVLDELVFAKTGQNLDYLQKNILEGVFNGQKYAEIAKNTHLSEGDIRDNASDLWKILSEVLEEEINKSNIRAVLEKSHFYNNIGRDVVSFHNVNICTNTPSSLETDQKSSSHANAPYLYLGNAPDIIHFYGRSQEL
jgi:hypothetical protein